MFDQKELAGLAAMARRLRVPASWLKAEADADRLPHIKAGSQRLFNVAAVEAALAERARQSSPETKEQDDGR